MMSPRGRKGMAVAPALPVQAVAPSLSPIRGRFGRTPVARAQARDTIARAGQSWRMAVLPGALGPRPLRKRAAKVLKTLARLARQAWTVRTPYRGGGRLRPARAQPRGG